MNSSFLVFVSILMMSILEVAKGMIKLDKRIRISERLYCQSFEEFQSDLSKLDPEILCSEVFSAENYIEPQCSAEIVYSKSIRILNLEERPLDSKKINIIQCRCEHNNTFPIIPDNEGKFIFTLQELNSNEYEITGHWIRELQNMK